MGAVAWSGRHQPFAMRIDSSPCSQRARPHTAVASPRTSVVQTSRQRRGDTSGGVGDSTYFGRDGARVQSAPTERATSVQKGREQEGSAHPLGDWKWHREPNTAAAKIPDPADLHLAPNGLFVSNTMVSLGLAVCLPETNRPKPQRMQPPRRPPSRGTDPRRLRLGLHTAPPKRSPGPRTVPPWEVMGCHPTKAGSVPAEEVLFTVAPLQPSEPRDGTPIEEWDHPVRSRTPRGPDSKPRARTAGHTRSRLALTYRGGRMLS